MEDKEMTKRDDFSEKVKRTMAMRVGYFCSNPDCRRPTAGPAIDEQTATHFGKAAHISAAAQGGKRYDPVLTQEQRRNLANGIWLCSNCADIIDKDDQRYPINLLNKWKKDAETFSFQTFATSPVALPNIKLNFQLDELDLDFLQQLGLSKEDNIENTINRMRISALEDIASFRNTRTWPVSTIPLNLTLRGSHTKAPVTLEGLAKSAMFTDRINIISPPGTGKTITLTQLTEYILNADQTIAVLIPLGEWSDYSDTFFENLIKRNSFRSFKPEHFMQLAYYGRLILILDGWNELNPESRIKAERHIAALKRDFPQLAIVASSRQQTSPIEGVFIKIEPLSDDQQMKLANQLHGEKGEAIINQAWRIPSLRELITVPLYFNALLSSVPSGELPKTKDEVLAFFIDQHEKSPEKFEILQNKLQGFQKIILQNLGAEANRLASTSLSNEDARRTISQTMRKLQDEQQITSPLQPNDVLNTLVNTHLLTRSSLETATISFQHQQFQEWYASFQVEQLILDSFQGNNQSKGILQADILNWLAWEESVLFACERLSRKDTSGLNAVAATIINALAIDPMLAAEIIFRTTPDVWPLISGNIMDFIKRWHKPNKVDRAFRFMIISGRPDFSEYIWPLISNKDNQVYLEALHIAHPFHPSVLGSNARKRLTELPEDIRCHVLAEIGLRSRFDGIELVTDLAKIDPSSQVVVEIIESLQFRRAERHVKTILQTAPDAVWELIASRDYPSKLLDPTQNTRLTTMRQSRIASETDPIKIINYLTGDGSSQVDAEERIIQLIQSPEFPITNVHVGFAIEKAFKIYPRAVATALLQRITTGLQIPYKTEEYLENIPSIDEGPIATAALNGTSPTPIAKANYTIIGPVTAGQIMDKLFAIDEKFRSDHKLDQIEKDEYHRLSGALLISRQSSFLSAIFERSNTDQLSRIEIMSDLLARHGKNHEINPLIVSEDIKIQLTETIKKWIELALASSEAIQHQLSNITRAIVRLPNAEFIDDLHAMLKRELKEQATLRNPTPIGQHQASHDYTHQYRQTFSAIGGERVSTLMMDYLSDLKFGLVAACILRDIWNKKNPSIKNSGFRPWNDFSGARENSRSLHDETQAPTSCEQAEEIFKVITKLVASNHELEQMHAINLAKVALSMPHGIKHTELKALYALSQKFSHKKELLTAAAMAGETIPVSILNAGLEELLTDAQAEPWRLNETNGELMGWIELFAFSDQPIAVIDAINLLPATYQHSWQMDRLLLALGYSPHEQALLTLKTVAQRDPQITKQYGWLDAFFKQGTEASAHALLDLICNGSVLENDDPLGTWKVSNKLANLIDKFPTIQDEILQRYEKITDPKLKAVIEETLVKLSNPSIIFTLIKSFATNTQPYDHKLSEVIRSIAIGQRPLTDWDGAFEQFSVPLTDLRKKLFEMVTMNDGKSTLAEACLIKIEEVRDEYGRILDEPRHPDVLTGRSWPKEASDALNST